MCIINYTHIFCFNFIFLENPTVHSVKRTSTIQGTPVLTHRHALNDLSNTARKAQHGGNSKPVCVYVQYVCIST